MSISRISSGLLSLLLFQLVAVSCAERGAATARSLVEVISSRGSALCTELGTLKVEEAPSMKKKSKASKKSNFLSASTVVMRCELLSEHLDALSSAADAMTKDQEETHQVMADRGSAPEYRKELDVALLPLVDLVLGEKCPLERALAQAVSSKMTQWILDVTTNSKKDDGGSSSSVGSKAGGKLPQEVIRQLMQQKNGDVEF